MFHLLQLKSFVLVAKEYIVLLHILASFDISYANTNRIKFFLIGNINCIKNEQKGTQMYTQCIQDTEGQKSKRKHTNKKK